MHLWHDISTGADAPAVIHAVIEIPRGSRNKYELDPRLGVIKLDRVLYAAVHYPGDYGFLPQTAGIDGDPLDVLVLMNTPTFPGCLLDARPIGLLRMRDGGMVDDKLVAVPLRDPFFDHYRDYTDVPPHFRKELTHFFATYKTLEGIETEPLGWGGAEAAHAWITAGMTAYGARYGRREREYSHAL